WRHARCGVAERELGPIAGHRACDGEQLPRRDPGILRREMALAEISTQSFVAGQQLGAAHAADARTAGSAVAGRTGCTLVTREPADAQLGHALPRLHRAGAR